MDAQFETIPQQRLKHFFDPVIPDLRRRTRRDRLLRSDGIDIVEITLDHADIQLSKFLAGIQACEVVGLKDQKRDRHGPRRKPSAGKILNRQFAALPRLIDFYADHLKGFWAGGVA